MSKKKLTKAIAIIGKSMSKLDINTNCPLIHYQQPQPNALKKMREAKNNPSSK